MLSMLAPRLSAALILSIAGTASAQWVGPAAPDNRMKYEGGPVYVGTTGLTTAKFGVIESSPGARVIGSYAFIGTPGNGSRTTAIWGETNNPTGRALQGFNFATADSGDTNNPATGIWAETASVTGMGIRARATATSGVSYAAYFDNASSSGFGAYVTAPVIGLFAVATSTTATTYSIWGRTDTTSNGGSAAVLGQARGATGNSAAIRGEVTSASGYSGYFMGGMNYFEGSVGIGTASPATKLDVTGSSSTGLILGTNSSTAAGTAGSAVAGVKGVISAATPGGAAAGVWGVATTTSASAGYGVAGYHAMNNGVGVAGFIASGGAGVAVYGQASGSAFAGFYNGNVTVLGTLAKTGGSFKIDHPLDPAHKTLSHSFVESPDMMNIYNGNIRTDAAGYATITMPDWFEALNRDFRYQLTVIDENDDVWAMAKVVREINNGQFTIRTNLPNQKVSWQVTGIRHDNWANANRIPVEQVKPAHEQNKYISPLEHGQPASAGIGYRDTTAFAQEAQAINARQIQLDKEAKDIAAKSKPAPARSSPLSNPPPLTPAAAGGN